MQANYVQRLRLTFGKTGPARYVGHLDLARTLERSFNRAKIPVAYTQGFNRRPRMAFAAPLPLGFSGAAELADIWLAEKMEPQTAREQMMAKMAPGIVVDHIDDVSLRAPSLQTVTAAATYSVSLLDLLGRSELQRRINQALSAQELIREWKRGKKEPRQYDLRPLIVELHLGESVQDQELILMKLLLMAGKTGRPDEVLRALGIDPHTARIERTKIILESPTI